MSSRACARHREALAELAGEPGSTQSGAAAFAHVGRCPDCAEVLGDLMLTVVALRRLAASSEANELARHGERVEEQQLLTVVDRVGRHVLAPGLGRLPLRVWCLPVPQAGSQLAHGAMLLKRSR